MGFGRRTSTNKLIQLAAGLAALLATAPTQARACTGDCNGDGMVTVNEIITMVNIDLGSADVSACQTGGGNPDTYPINDIIAAIGFALNSNCPVDDGGMTCGDGVAGGTEECDDGGTCIGGSNAGTHCTSEAACLGNGVCTDGVKVGTSCASGADCGGAACQKCRPQGGDGCAANCTHETDIPTTLVPGVDLALGIKDGTSGEVIYGEVLTIPLALVGTQTVTVGRVRSDDPAQRIPYIIKAASMIYRQIPIGLCGFCVRGVEVKTCGGSLFDPDGHTSPSCTVGFPGQLSCPADKPCTAVHGTGNSATGFISCGVGGLDGVDVLLTQDAGGETGAVGKVQTFLSGHGQQGSAFLLNSTAIGTHVGPCPATFCSNADPIAERGTPITVLATTGTATAVVFNANGQDGVGIVDPATGDRYSANGVPANCSALRATPPSLSGYATAGAFPMLGLPTLGDIVLTSNVVIE